MKPSAEVSKKLKILTSKVLLGEFHSYNLTKIGILCIKEKCQSLRHDLRSLDLPLQITGNQENEPEMEKTHILKRKHIIFQVL